MIRARSDEQADPGGHYDGCKCAKTRKPPNACMRAGRRTTKSEIRDNILSDVACGTRLSSRGAYTSGSRARFSPSYRAHAEALAILDAEGWPSGRWRWS